MLRPSVIALTTALAAALLAAGCASPTGSTAAEQRAHILDMREQTVADVDAAHPGTRARLEHVPGYGVFSNVRGQVLFVGAGQGYGVVSDRLTQEDTYMKMVSLGAGYGFGAKDFRALFVFNQPSTLVSFVESGWEFGGSADATAKSGAKGAGVGGAGTASPNMEIYVVTDSGVLAQASIAGTKYWRDSELNETPAPHSDSE